MPALVPVFFFRGTIPFFGSFILLVTLYANQFYVDLMKDHFDQSNTIQKSFFHPESLASGFSLLRKCHNQMLLCRSHSFFLCSLTWQ